jgi:hypothetical protein
LRPQLAVQAQVVQIFGLISSAVGTRTGVLVDQSAKKSSSFLSTQQKTGQYARCVLTWLKANPRKSLPGAIGVYFASIADH